MSLLNINNYAELIPNSVSEFLTFGVSALLCFVFMWKILEKRNVSIPMVKGGLPFFGVVFDMLQGSPWDKMAKWTLQHGNIFRIHLFGSDAVVVADPELLKIVLKLKLSCFNKDTAWTYKPFMPLLGRGLVTSEGEQWRAQRAMMGSHLKIDILQHIPKMAVDAVERLCIKLDAAKENGSTLDMSEEFRHLTLQVIAEAVFSISAEESDKTFAHMYLPIVEEGNLRTWAPQRMYLPTYSWFKFHNDVNRLNDYVTGLVTKRWELRRQEAKEQQRTGIPTSRPQDVLDKTLSVIEEEDWNMDTINQVRDQMKTFVLAGHETSASMLTWALYELSISSGEKARRKLLAEANDAYGKLTPGSIPSKDAVTKLVFTECCLRESLRKYSVVPSVVRMVNKDVQLGDYHVCKGSTIMICMQGVHHNPEYWPEPLVYKPERFLEPVKSYTFLPFIEGPRMCLGQYLSLLESKIVLSMLLSRYRFEIVNNDAGEKHPFMVPIIPKCGHHVRVY